jgi:Phenylacetic acid catabolic protein
MSAEQALRSISADLASLKLALRRLYVVWCVGGPTLEASSAVAAMAQEEAGHARILARLAGTATATVDVSRLVPIDEVTSWPQLVGVAGPLENALAALLDGLKSAEEPEFSRNLTKIAAEERYHAQFYVGWFHELERNDNDAGRIFKAARVEAEARVAEWLSAARPVLVETTAPIPEFLGDGSYPDLSPDLETVCVHCGSRDIEVTSAFGGSLMTSLLKCQSCGGQFEAVRYRTAAIE